jgi:flagellar hook assembly protein FlgD
VSLKIYDILGREIKTLVNEFQNAGYKSVLWDGRNNNGAEVSSGVYFCKIIAGDFVDVKKMAVIK